GGDLGGAVPASGPAEPVVQRHGGIGRTDHERHGEPTARGDDHVAAVELRGGAGGHRSLYSGRTRTPRPLTRVTAYTSATNRPSASAMAIERPRRRRCCSGVSTMPGSVGS